MHEHPDVDNLMPPGTYLEMLDHPSGDSRTMELAIFKEHRFAFYFWNRWTNNLNTLSAPTLITIDWHRDMAPPSGVEKEALEQLSRTEVDKVSEFIWSKLDSHNDSHVLSAAYLNIIGDILLLKNYGDETESVYRDYQNNKHLIREFREPKHLERAVAEQQSGPYYLDLDLDFFVKGKIFSHQMKEVEPYSREEIAELIDPDSKLFQTLFQKLEGITMATEPRYCGGILKSNRILKHVMKQLFTDDLQWKHLI